MATEQEYLDYLQKNVSWLERLGDELSGADERLDYAVRQLLAIQEQILQLKISPETIAKLDRLTALIEELKEAGFAMPVRTEQITFQQILAPLQGVRLVSNVPIDGKITSITLHFPLGCAALVDIAFGYMTRQIVPSQGFIALDNATPVFPASEIVKRDEQAWCIMRNADAMNPHAPSVIVTIEGD